MGCFLVAEFLLTSASRGPSAIAEPLVRKGFLREGLTQPFIHFATVRPDAGRRALPRTSIFRCDYETEGTDRSVGGTWSYRS